MVKRHKIINPIKLFFIKLSDFLSKRMWHLNEDDVKGIKGFLINSLKAVIMAVKGFFRLDLYTKASALTYSTVLSIVPMLAVLVAVAKGFGIQQILYEQLTRYTPTNQKSLEQVLGFIENYLSQIQSGWFLGLGLIILFYTILNLLLFIEGVFNKIWEVPQGRSLKRRLFDYLGMLMIIPILITISTGLNIVMTTVHSPFLEMIPFFTPMVNKLLTWTPVLIIIGIFTLLFISLPNTKVKFWPALVSGIIAGVSFQVFQNLYLGGVLWISRYNAVYGGFAAFPLLLLWLQLTWVIILFCARLNFSIQNVDHFAYDRESSNVSRFYQDFLTVLLMGHIVKRFANHDAPAPYSVVSLSKECRIPIALTSNIIEQLLDVQLIIEVDFPGKGKMRHFQPAISTEKITVGELLTKLDRNGSEKFSVDMNKYQYEWYMVKLSRALSELNDNDCLLIDLPLGDNVTDKKINDVR